MDVVNFLLDRPLALLIVLAIGGVIGIAVERMVATADRDKRRAYWRGRNWKGEKGAPASSSAALGRKDSAGFAADQLKAVCRHEFGFQFGQEIFGRLQGGGKIQICRIPPTLIDGSDKNSAFQKYLLSEVFRGT